MADAVVIRYKNPEGNMTRPLNDAKLHRWSLSAGNTDTHATGLTGIIETALSGTRTTNDTEGVLTFPTGNITISSVSAAGVVTFAAAGATVFDLLVWTKG